MTFNGLHQYAYDAWGRMTTATRSRAGDWLRSPAQVPVPRALPRPRAGDSLRSAAPVPVPRALPKPRDGSARTLKQHLWGARTIDELVQVAANTGIWSGVPGIHATSNTDNVAVPGGSTIGWAMSCASSSPRARNALMRLAMTPVGGPC